MCSFCFPFLGIICRQLVSNWDLSFLIFNAIFTPASRKKEFVFYQWWIPLSWLSNGADPILLCGFLSYAQHGGSTNAFTSSEHTNYYFDINTDGFEEALDRYMLPFFFPYKILCIFILKDYMHLCVFPLIYWSDLLSSLLNHWCQLMLQRGKLKQLILVSCLL